LSLYESVKKRSEQPPTTQSSISDFLKNSVLQGNVNNKSPDDADINLVNELTFSGLKSAQKELIGKSHLRVSAVGDFNLKLVKEIINREFSEWDNPQSYKIPSPVEYKCVNLIDDATFFLPGTSKIGKALILPTGIKKGDDDFEILNIVIGIMLERTLKTLRMINLGDCPSQCGILLPVTLEDCYIQIGFYECLNNGCAERLCDLCQAILLTINEIPITDDDLEKYKKDRSIEIKDDQTVQFYLEESFDEEKIFSRLASPQIFNITTYQVNEIAKKYIKKHKIVTIQAGDIK
jgi:hypothetical protein